MQDVCVFSKCSGRRDCRVLIPDPELFEAQPCPKDLVAYLDATYNCRTGGFWSYILFYDFVLVRVPSLDEHTLAAPCLMPTAHRQSVKYLSEFIYVVIFNNRGYNVDNWSRRHGKVVTLSRHNIPFDLFKHHRKTDGFQQISCPVWFLSRLIPNSLG